MYKIMSHVFGVILLFQATAWGQQISLEEELRSEMAQLKARIARIETMLEQLKNTQSTNEYVNQKSKLSLRQTKQDEQQKPRKQAPAINTPPMLPPSQPEAYKKSLPRIDILLQSRGDFFASAFKNDTFFLRKAELGIKGHIATHVDFSLELDPVRPADPFRRTYIRLTHVPWLHVKFGLEKAPIGLEELTATAKLPFVDRSEVNDRFAAAEELGVHIESRWTQWLFQLAVTNGGRRLLRDNNKHKDVTTRIVWAPYPWLSSGVAMLQGQVGNESIERDRYNIEFKLGSNLSGFQSEFYRAKDGRLWSSAYYVAIYRAFSMSKAWLTHLQPVIRYEQIERGDSDRQQELQLLTFGVAILFSDHRSKFQINYLKDLLTGTRKDEIRAQYQIEF